MSKKIVRFSKLLRIFKVNERTAFIIELEENNQKNLYISFSNKEGFRCFESYNDTKLKNKFKNLPKKCLMSQCTNATCMFQNSIITHFEADCSSLIYGRSMFASSSLYSIKTEFPKLKNAELMFCTTKIKEFKINLPELKIGDGMFYGSSLEKITSKFPMLENAQYMFEWSNIKEINCQFPKIKDKVGMFDNTSSELKQNFPQYFI